MVADLGCIVSTELLRLDALKSSFQRNWSLVTKSQVAPYPVKKKLLKIEAVLIRVHWK